MTHEAKMAIFEILFVAQDRLDTVKSNGVFWILANTIDEYFKEWGWIMLTEEAHD